MSERDELAQLIQDGSVFRIAYVDAAHAADAVLAAGWRAPLQSPWDCGHEYKVGNWGHDGECIRCAVADLPPHKHEWLRPFGTEPGAGPAFRECCTCGTTENLTMPD